MRKPTMTAAVLKVSSRCNLNCTYCYMFNLEDKTFWSQPATMSSEVCLALITSVARHCRRHSLSSFVFIFHGGEPLLAKDSFFTDFVDSARTLMPRETRLAFLLQTNGALLSEARCRSLRGLGIRVGISIDGPEREHDTYRLDHQGRGSYASAIAGWHNATSAGAHPGLLSVVNPLTDVSIIYQHAKRLHPRKVDFLLPDANHDHPPPGGPTGAGDGAYGEWLLRLFDLWIADADRDFEIRLFADILRLLVSPRPADGSPKRGYNGTFFVEPDGSIETLDLLRSCENGLARTRFTVYDNEIDDVFADPLVELYYRESEFLCQTCAACELAPVCGGGSLAHRFRGANGFDNPSVYCADLKHLIGGIRNWLSAAVIDSGAVPSASDFVEPAALVQ